MALIARITRASMLEVLSQDYIRTARAKGLPPPAVLLRHALKNAAVPIVTIIGVGVALLLGGVVVTESVFAIPGIGRLIVDAILRRDYPVIQGVLLIFSARLRPRQPAHRPALRRARPAHPVLMPTAAADLVRGRAGRAPPRAVPRGVVAAPSHRRARRRSCSLLWSLIAVARALALARDDPQTISPDRAACEPPSAEHLVRHRPLRPRRLEPHDLRRPHLARRSASSWPLLATAIGLAIGLVSGYNRLARHRRHARHGRPDVDPGHPARHRA